MGHSRCCAFLVRQRSRLHGLAYLTLLLLARPNDYQDVVTFGALALGFALRVWALGCISKNRVLCTWGPYRYMRNPLYLANLLIGIGLIVQANHWLATAACTIVLGATYLATIRSEERRLAELFGEEYAAYCRATPRLLPWRRPRLPRHAGRGFEWRRALSAGLVAQMLGLALLVGCMESKEEYYEGRGIVQPVTYGLAPVDLAPNTDGVRLASYER